jgi:DNA-binding NtrC family response regulator
LNDGSTIHLLIVGDSPDEAEHVTAILRSAGYAPRTVRTSNTSELAKALGQETFDVVLHMLTAKELKLGFTVKAIKARGLMTPVLAAGEGTLTAGQVMATGAADRIMPDDDDHLRLVILRELAMKIGGELVCAIW